MTLSGHKLTLEQREKLSKAHRGQRPWNAGTGGCKRGHDPSLYVPMPGSGIYVCLGCKRENSLKYRIKNRKEINLKNRIDRYKISLDSYQELLNLQNGRCAICGTEINQKTCRIDHDHTTGKVRGLLCTSCNTGIGLFKDSSNIILNAAEYLKSNDR